MMSTSKVAKVSVELDVHELVAIVTSVAEVREGIADRLADLRRMTMGAVDVDQEIQEHLRFLRSIELKLSAAMPSL